MLYFLIKWKDYPPSENSWEPATNIEYIDTPSEEEKDDDHIIGEVERIIGKRKRAGRIEYNVKWKTLPENKSTWEPIFHLNNALQAIMAYERKRIHKQKYRIV